jgi:activating signal cointegrator complex subunit 1
MIARVAPWLPSEFQTILRQQASTMPRHSGYKKSSGPKKPPLTHFLCLPIVNSKSRPQLEKSMQEFREAVTRKDPASTKPFGQSEEAGRSEQETVVSGVHPKAIRPVGALHLTLGVMSLKDEKLNEAVEFLKNLDVSNLMSGTPTMPVIEPEPPNSASTSTLERPISPPPTTRSNDPLNLDLRGLTSMHPPRKTSILYIAPSDESRRLYPFCLALQKTFTEAGFLLPDDRKLKLHATIVNTIYAKGRTKRLTPNKKSMRETPDPEQTANPGPEVPKGQEDEDGNAPEQDDRSQGHGPDAKAPLRLDATAILERFQDFVWAENVVLDRIAICEMGAKKITNADGNVIGEEYTEVAAIELPR